MFPLKFAKVVKLLVLRSRLATQLRQFLVQLLRMERRFRLGLVSIISTVGAEPAVLDSATTVAKADGEERYEATVPEAPDADDENADAADENKAYYQEIESPAEPIPNTLVGRAWSALGSYHDRHAVRVHVRIATRLEFGQQTGGDSETSWDGNTISRHPKEPNHLPQLGQGRGNLQ